jgi:phosphohistidine swiveling domain-containing protein
MKWDIDTSESVMWIASEAAKSLTGSMKKKVGICFIKHICSVKDSFFKWCTLEEENLKVGNFLVEKFKNKKFVDKFVRDYKQFDKNSIKILNNLDNKDLSKLSNKELFNLLKESNDIYIGNFDFGFIMEPMDFVMPDMIESRLKEQGYTQHEISDMLAIADIIFLNVELQKLIGILKNKKKEQLELIKKHAYEYRWMWSAHLGRKDISLSHFKKKLTELRRKNLNQELKKLKNSRQNVLDRKKQLMKKKPLDKETKQLIRITDIIAPLHDRRKELFLRSIYTEDTARIEIAKRYGYTLKQLSVFQIEELFKLKQGKKLDKVLANKRIKHCLMYINRKKGIWKYYHGKEAKAFEKKELSVDHGNVTEIKGMIANPGIAKGIVRIIHNVGTMDCMKKGDILVSSMTKPEIIPAIKKAAAIITDEGGVTCHASIVSREFHIPCIIGTKIASHVLKDGDLVEVDANKGVVRKIK